MRAFTLIETLVAVTVVATMMALFALSASHLRQEARIAVDLSHVRQHAATHLLYTTDHDGAFYSAGLPDINGSIVFPSGLVNPYFMASHNWRGEMGDGYIQDSHSDIFLSPFAEVRLLSNNAYVYSCSFLATPAFWAATTRESTNQYLASRVHDVLYPSRKSLLHDQHLHSGQRANLAKGVSKRWISGFTDGSADAAHSASAGYPSAEALASGIMLPGAVHGQDFANGTHTLGGVRGADR